MFKYTLSLPKYKLRAYEIRLAIHELDGLFPEISEKKITNKFIEFETNKPLDEEKLKRLTFFSQVEFENLRISKTKIIPNQVLFEKLNSGNNQCLFDVDFANTSREIRYLTHSFHEYKGRFYPQLVKSLINYSGTKKGETLLDPFCGSGTSLVESFLCGLNAVGTDINPIAYLIAKSKIRSLRIEAKDLEKTIQQYAEFIGSNVDIDVKSFEHSLDIDYLQNWFPLENLKKVLVLIGHIDKEVNDNIKLLLKVTLSNILRDVSYQDPTQLRIRRRKDEPRKNIFEEFNKNLYSNINVLRNFHNMNFEKPDTKIQNFLCDVKNLKSGTELENNSIDLVVTSPPYATALPYIDTDRISLFAFGYADSKDAFRQLEKTMIGNREITPKEREQLENEMVESFTNRVLPNDVTKLIEKIYFLNKNTDVGFRRKNTACLLFKYFSDMKLALEQINQVLKSNRYVYMVVGNNRTTAGDELIKIPTDEFIGITAEKVGFKFERKICLEVQKSYSIHSKNSINTESILVLRK